MPINKTEGLKVSTQQGVIGSTPQMNEWRFSTMPDDKTIITSVRAALERDARIDHPAEIAVSCQAGWVVLRGTVAAPRQRRVAQEVARSAPGVKGVEVELRVDLRDRWEDGELRGAALQALITVTGVPADRVDVLVADGWLTLKGEVSDQSASDAAFAAVSELPRVGGINNEIKVVTAGVDG
jgi:osmotically-inducible protein OsmY